MAYETVIGLEVHAQLLSVSKLFCGCSTHFGAKPNENVCPVCLGLPGSLPVVNGQAVRLAVRTALALGCRIVPRSVFARKQYFYPDLPKGYQISQYEEPFSVAGHLDIDVEGTERRVRICRVHMEEDAGKNVHGVAGDSLVDLNRAGVPLVEIVSEPDLRSSAEAAAYLRTLRDVLIFVGVNDGNLEEGSFRCDANVSIRPTGESKLGTRTELKNLNSFRFVQRAIDAEVARQTAIVERGGEIVQETRAFDPDTGQTRSLRSKEDAHDYRYFPDPDLPPLAIPEELLADERSSMPELPKAVRQRYVSELGISAGAAATLTQHPEYVRFFEETLRTFPKPVVAANWLQTEVLRVSSLRGLSAEFPVQPGQVAELLSLIDGGEISGKQGKEIFAAMLGTEERPREIVERRGLRVVSDLGTLRPLCETLLRENPKQVDQYRSGKKGILGFFVGQVMKATGGSGDPKLVSQLLTELLESE